MADLNGHEAGNGGHSQGMPKLVYSETRGQREDESARLFRPRSGLQIQGIIPGANTNSHTNRTRWLSHAAKSIAGESGRRAVSQAAGAAEALGPYPAEENGSEGPAVCRRGTHSRASELPSAHGGPRD